MTAEERFWSKVRKGPACWEWTASRRYNGYGDFWQGTRHIRAHRFSWELRNGQVPRGLLVLHRCDNPPCVNPGHLFLGTYADNNADMRSKGRAVEPPRPIRGQRWAYYAR